MNFDFNIIFSCLVSEHPDGLPPGGIRSNLSSEAPFIQSGPPFGRVATSFHEVKARFASTSRFLADGSPAKVLEVSLASREVGIAQRKPFRAWI